MGFQMVGESIVGRTATIMKEIIRTDRKAVTECMSRLMEPDIRASGAKAKDMVKDCRFLQKARAKRYTS